KRHRLQMLAGTFLLIGWCGYFGIGAHVSKIIAGRFGSILWRIARGKINDLPVFVCGRFREFLWLLTLATVWATIHMLMNRSLEKRTNGQRWRWTVHGVTGFVLLNVWVGAAANTALFWGIIGGGAGIQNYAQFQFKRIVFEENAAPRRAVLVGSSQTRAQIDEDQLNRRLGTNLWTTELHFPGSKAYDLLLIEPKLRRANPQWVICYLSEGYFYTGSHGEVPPNFLAWRQLPDAWQRGALKYLSNDEVGYGLLGDILPIFRCRDVISQRVLGSVAVNLPQTRYDASLITNLEARAGLTAKSYRSNRESEFQKRAFEDFIIRCEQAQRTVVLLEGGYNPILARQLDPAIRADMLKFLAELNKRHPNVIVIPSEDLPVQLPTDYSDLSHVTEEMQGRFTQFLAGWLQKRLAEQRDHGDK
ncbi:MAG TPA: hypothetical protein VK327_00690, partial [Candidatus Paceibacterota bacterium]|nr:hypothetical protein [Candidatus Paceibacterota bacterium]